MNETITAVPCNRPGILAVKAHSSRTYPRHMHDDFGIGVILAGAQRSASGRGPVEAGPGSLITVNPGEVHDGAPLTGSGRRWNMLYLPPALVGGLTQDLRQERYTGQEFIVPVLADHRTAGVFIRLFANLTGSRGDHADLAIDTDLLHLAARLLRPPRPAPARLCTASVSKAIDRINQDPAAVVSLAELAQITGLSRFQFLRVFARQTGLTPHAYQVQRRIQLARQLIVRGLPLADAAAAAGFSDQSHMTRLFRRTLGYAPGALARSGRAPAGIAGRQSS